MKTKIIMIVVGMFLVPTVCRSESKWFYEDGIIQDGDVYSYVGVYNDAIVDMIGGQVTSGLMAYDSSTVNISGGYVYGVTGGDNTHISTSGTMEGYILNLVSCSSFNVNEGTLGKIEVYNSSSGSISGGTISDYLLAYGTEDLVISLYGYGFEYDPLAGYYRGGQLTGFWLDDTPFSIDLYYDDTPGGPVIDTWSHITLIPEPATILLFGLGIVLLRKRN